MPVLPFFRVRLLGQLPSQIIENPQTIGQHIRKRRLQLGLKQAQVAKQFGVSEDTITFWENERAAPQIQFYPKLIQFLGYNPIAIDTQTVGGQIYLYRVENGMSVKKLAELTAFDSATLARWELNQRLPNSAAQARLKALKII